MRFVESWRAGFELELVVGDLDDLRFALWADEPMDVASREFCSAVAADLAGTTGYRWLAAHKRQQRNGFFVYPEYDLDPLNWPSGLIAGVELVTPPLPLSQAGLVRRRICEWVDSIDGHINKGAGWAHELELGGRAARTNARSSSPLHTVPRQEISTRARSYPEPSSRANRLKAVKTSRRLMRASSIESRKNQAGSVPACQDSKLSASCRDKARLNPDWESDSTVT